jgi:hypothetical protein
MVAAPCTAPPALNAGDTVFSGRYFHNLEKVKAPKRYPKDSDPTPRFGRRLKVGKLRWEPDGLSANSTRCTCNRCTVFLHADADRFAHVLEIDLECWSRETDIQLVAVYDPTTNVCHFLIQALDIAQEDLEMSMEHALNALEARLSAKFPQQLPKEAGMIAVVDLARAALDRVFTIHENCHARYCWRRPLLLGPLGG